MWTRTHTQVYQDIKREDIWRIWTDVNNWAVWHEDLDYCKLEGPFTVGNHFILKPKGAPAVKIALTEIEEGWKFTDSTTFFGAKMYDTHEIEETEEGLRLINRLEVTGPLKFLWVKLVAQNVAATVPQDMETLVTLARAHGA